MNRITANATQLQDEIMREAADLREIHAQEAAIDAKIIEGAQPFIELGATVFRLRSRKYAKTAKDAKKPIEKWGELPPRSLEEIQATGRKPLENFAVALGSRAKTAHGYLHCIDYDLDDPAMKSRADAALNFALPKDARAFAVRSGSGNGYHFYFFAPEPLPGQTIEKVEGAFEVVLKGTGQYVVAPGSLHPDTGKPYRWIKGKRLEADMLDMVAPPVVNLTPFKRAEPEPIETEDSLIAELLGPIGPRASFKDIRAALEFVGDHDNRDTWLRVGAALHHWDNGGDSGYQLWCEWSEQSHKFDSKGQAQTWKSLGRSRGPRVTVASIFAMAREGGWSLWTDDDFPDLPEPFEDLVGGDGDPLDLTGNADKPKAALRFLTPDQCATAPKRGYIVKGLLAPRDVAAIVGAPGCGKSTVAPLIGYMVAQGKEAFGQRTRQGGVFYVAAEDETGLQMRVAALRREHGDTDGFNVVAGVSDLLDKESGQLAALVEAVKAQRPSLVILDTLAMAFPGLEENDAAAMGRVVHVARRLTKWGAAVVLIHHDTKAGDGLPRGHSILNGALDVSLALKRDGKSVTGHLSKNRNGPCDLTIEFEIDSAELGEDEDGELINAALCRPTDDPFAELAETRPRSEKGRVFMDVLYSIMEKTGGEFAKVADVKMRLVQSQALSRSDKSGTQRKAFNRLKDELAGQGIITGLIPSKDPGTCIKPLVSREDCLGDWMAGQAGHERDKRKMSHMD